MRDNMILISNLAKKILERSNSYKYYRNEFEQNKKRIKRLEEIEATNNRLINTIFLDYELTPAPIHQKFIDLSMEYLTFIDNVCQKHDIEWWIEGGNLLGAVRHNGAFIPWDDDIDGGMLRKDYNRFIDEVFPSEIEKYGLSNNINIDFKKRRVQGKRVYAFAQLFYKDDVRNSPTLTALDIFPYDFKKDDEGEDLGNEFEEVRQKLYKDMIDGLDLETILKRYYENFNLSYEKQDYMLPGVEGGYGPKDVFPYTRYATEKMLPLDRINFNGVMLPCPNDPDYYLTIHYKNYRNIPQVLTFHNRMKKLRRTEDIVEILDDNIEKLKKVNEEFEW